MMVGPPSDVKSSGCGLFLWAPDTKEGINMRWLGNLIVYVGIAVMVSFFVYVAIQSNKNDKEKK